jgi:hypothetical protein
MKPHHARPWPLGHAHDDALLESRLERHGHGVVVLYFHEFLCQGQTSSRTHTHTHNEFAADGSTQEETTDKVHRSGPSIAPPPAPLHSPSLSVYVYDTPPSLHPSLPPLSPIPPSPLPLTPSPLPPSSPLPSSISTSVPSSLSPPTTTATTMPGTHLRRCRRRC